MEQFEKSASSSPGRDRLRREADLLVRARHPGVVTLLRCDDAPDRTRLVLARPTDRTLAAEPPDTAEDALRTIAALATTVADLHAIGIAHRRLRPDHVLLADDRPVICGFAEGTTTASAEDRALDEAALRDLVELLATHVGVAAGRRGRAGRALRALTTPDHDGSLTAAALARRASRASGRHPARHGRAPLAPGNLGHDAPNTTPDNHPALERGRRRRPRLAAALVVPAVVALVVAWPGRAANEVDPALAPAPTTAANHRPTGTERGHVTSTDAGSPASPTAPPSPGVSSDDAVHIDAGGVTYAVGTRGDQVIVADWTCTGVPTAVLLRPRTGEVFFFAALPDADLTITGRRIATVPDAHEIVADDVDTSCPALAVRDTAGTAHRIGAP